MKRNLKPRNRPADRFRAFSLIEMLMVMAVIGLLTGISMPAISSLMNTRSLERAGSDITSLLESARAHALANNTPVWVGFKDSGQGELLVGVVASRNGEIAPAQDDLVQISPTRKFSNIQMRALSASANRPAPNAQLASSSAAILPFSVSGAQAVNFDKQVVQFGSRGEMRIAASQLSKVVEIGLVEVVNGQPRNAANYAAIQMQGLSGAISLFRPQL